MTDSTPTNPYVIKHAVASGHRLSLPDIRATNLAVNTIWERAELVGMVVVVIVHALAEFIEIATYDDFVRAIGPHALLQMAQFFYGSQGVMLLWTARFPVMPSMGGGDKDFGPIAGTEHLTQGFPSVLSMTSSRQLFRSPMAIFLECMIVVESEVFKMHIGVVSRSFKCFSCPLITFWRKDKRMMG